MENENAAWDDLTKEERDRTIKYMTLMRRFNKDPKSLSFEFKKWVLQNADAPTDLVPLDIMQRYLLD